MRKNLCFLVVIVVLILIFTACTNPEGTLGPSWDIIVKIPLLKGTDKNIVRVEDLLGEEVNIEEGYIKNLLDNDSGIYNIGKGLTEINFPEEFSFSIPLEPIEISGLLNNEEFQIVIVDTDTGVFQEIGDIEFGTDFDSITIAAEDQEVIITVGSIDENTVDLISDLRLYIYNNDNVVGSFSFGTLTANQLNNGVKAFWNMSNLSFTGNRISLKLSAENISEVTGVNISLEFPSLLKVAEVENFNVERYNINGRVEREISLKDFKLNAGIVSVGFSTGSLSIKSNAALFGLFVDNLSIAGLNIGKGSISLAGQEFFVDGEKLELSVDITNAGGTINFNSNSEIVISGGFSNVEIAYILVNIDEALDFINFKGEIQIDETKIKIEDKLRKELSKIEISPEMIIDVVHPDGMILDPFYLVFSALDVQGNLVAGELKIDLTTAGQGNNTIVLAEESIELFNLLKNLDVNRITSTCRYGISSLNNEIKITSDSKIGIESIDIRIPYEFFLTEAIVSEIEPKKIGPVDSKIKGILENGIDVIMVIEKLDNSFLLDVGIEVYVANITDSCLSAEEKKIILYQRENLIMEKEIGQREYYDKYIVELTSDDIKIFTRKNIYAGIKIIIPASSGNKKYQFLPGDKMSFDRVYILLTGNMKVNN